MTPVFVDVTNRMILFENRAQPGDFEWRRVDDVTPYLEEILRRRK